MMQGRGERESLQNPVHTRGEAAARVPDGILLASAGLQHVIPPALCQTFQKSGKYLSLYDRQYALTSVKAWTGSTHSLFDNPLQHKRVTPLPTPTPTSTPTVNSSFMLNACQKATNACKHSDSGYCTRKARIVPTMHTGTIPPVKEAFQLSLQLLPFSFFLSFLPAIANSHGTDIVLLYCG